MNVLKLKEVGRDERNCGYKVFADNNGKHYSAFCSSGEEIMMRTFAVLNDSGERDMSVFTKEYCEYEGIERDEYVRIEIEHVCVSFSVDEARSIKEILEGILNNRTLMPGYMLRESHVYNIDSEDIEAMYNATLYLDEEIRRIEKCTN